MKIKLGNFEIDTSKIEFSGLKDIWKMFSYDMAIDLGTANILVWINDGGIVIKEPSVVARNKKTKEILAVGKDAKKMMGRSPKSIEVVRPLRDGVIADFDAAEVMLSHYIKKVHEPKNMLPKIPKPRVIIGIPSGVTEVERKAVGDAVISAGGREVNLVEEPMAAAIGAGLNVEKPDGKFIVDIGGGTSEIAVISLGGIVVGRSLRIAGDEMNEAIINYVKLKYSLLLGETTAENVKIGIGSFGEEKDKYHVARGRDLESGLPKSIKLTTHEVREALAPVAQEIIAGIIATVEETPPELLSDIMEVGITLAGGGSLVVGIDKLITEKTKIPVIRVEDPISCVVMGCANLLENKALLGKIRVTKGK